MTGFAIAIIVDIVAVFAAIAVVVAPSIVKFDVVVAINVVDVRFAVAL